MPKSKEGLCALVYFTKNKQKNKKMKTSCSSKTVVVNVPHAIPPKSVSLIISVKDTQAMVKIRQFYTVGDKWKDLSDTFFIVSKDLGAYSLCNFGAKCWRVKEQGGYEAGRELVQIFHCDSMDMGQAPVVKENSKNRRITTTGIKNGFGYFELDSSGTKDMYKLYFGMLEVGMKLEVSMTFFTDLKVDQNHTSADDTFAYNLRIPNGIVTGRLPYKMKKIIPVLYNGIISIRNKLSIVKLSSTTHDEKNETFFEINHINTPRSGGSGKELVAEFTEHSVSNTDLVFKIELEISTVTGDMKEKPVGNDVSSEEQPISAVASESMGNDDNEEPLPSIDDNENWNEGAGISGEQETSIKETTDASENNGPTTPPKPQNNLDHADEGNEAENAMDVSNVGAINDLFGHLSQGEEPSLDKLLENFDDSLNMEHIDVIDALKTMIDMN